MYSYTPDLSSKAAYVSGALADEGAATLKNIQVQREILARGGSDIGIAGNAANKAAYNKVYEVFMKTGNEAAARKSIGAIFGNGEVTANTGQPNNAYYGGWYERVYPTKK